MEKVNVLVCGCGGDIGQSIGKILGESAYVNKLVGCDSSEDTAAKFIYPLFLQGLPCSDRDYLESLVSLVEKHRIDLVIPVSEPELRFFSAIELPADIGGAGLLTASAKALKAGFDKMETAAFLKREGLPFPATQAISEEWPEDKFPVIIKPATGSGSRDVYLAGDPETFAFLKKKHPGFIVQEYLSGDGEEYTCGLFRSSRGIIRTIIFKRELMAGFSVYGEVVKNVDIESLMHRIATGLQLTGSINVQLKLTGMGPVVFEINPRFSSTVRFRHLMGFRDVEWCMEDKLNLPLSDYHPVNPGKKFYKGFNEYID